MTHHKDWDASYYKKHSELQKDAGLAIVEQYPFRGDEIVLDIGCGDGRTTAVIAAHVPQGKVIGMDPSPAMIAEAKRSFFLKNLSFIQTGAEACLYPQV